MSFTSFPKLLYADKQGRIKEHPSLLMAIYNRKAFKLPALDDLISLPAESELFYLPGRQAVGIDPSSGEAVAVDGLAVSAFAAPAYTLTASPAYIKEATAPILPLFAYGAAGYGGNRFWICAKKMDEDERQQFQAIPKSRIRHCAAELLKRYPKNRLIRHIIKNCVEKYDCPAARNFALGRFEAPLPTSRICNSHCLGCISSGQPGGAAQITPQCRLKFTPSSAEIVEVMAIHEKREKTVPVYSFGQGCEGDPLMNWQLLEESILKFRSLRNTGEGGAGTINCNTNASSPEAVKRLVRAGLTSMRVSLNSAIPEIYHIYYRPANYEFGHVAESIRIASVNGAFVSLNLLFFPGLTDTQKELEHLAKLCSESGVSMIQWRNLNMDPDWYRNKMASHMAEEPLGLGLFMKLLKEKCPWLRYGYFNPYLGDKAKNLRIPL